MRGIREPSSAIEEAEEAYIEAARDRYGPTGDAREIRARYEARLATLLATYDEATLRGR